MSKAGREWKKHPDSEGRYRCSRCNEFKSPDDFYRNARSANGLSDRCKPCNAAYMREYVGTRERRRQSPAKHEVYASLWQLQGGKCGICAAEADLDSPAPRRLVMDHCHSSGRLRGLLCTRCNVLLGSLERNLGLVERAMDYLLRHSDV